MKNQYDLPDWLYDTIKYLRDQYDPGISTDYSATSLLKPPMIFSLEKEHEVEEDVSDLFASFFGSSIHNSIEDAKKDDPRYIVEERFYRKIKVPNAPGRKKTFTISGQIDLYDTETRELSDHKYTSVMKYLMGEKDEYEKQLAINRWIMRGNGYDVDNCKINLLCKDWKKAEALRNPDYPNTPYVPIEFPLWHDDDVETFIRNQIVEKEWALRGHKRICTPEERWTRPSKYALMRKGRKSAIKLFDTEEEAEEYLKDLTKKVGGEYIEHRPGEDVRCVNWCNVNFACSYFQENYGEKK